MTVKEARKIISEAGLSVKTSGNDYLFWGYSRQGVPYSYLHIRVEKHRLAQVAEACQSVRARFFAGENFASAFAQHHAIWKALRAATTEN